MNEDEVKNIIKMLVVFSFVALIIIVMVGVLVIGSINKVGKENLKCSDNPILYAEHVQNDTVSCSCYLKNMSGNIINYINS